MSVLSSISLLSDAKFFDEKNSKFNELRENLAHKTMKKKLNAMKRLIAMMTLGRDVSSFFPDVVKNVIIDNTEIKKLVYMFLIHYAEDNQQLALLAINSLQQDLKSSNQRVRANALRAMSSISIKVVIPIVMIALKNAVRDTSSYVRKASACAIPKVWRTDPGRQMELIDMIAELLSNTEPNVLGATMFAFHQVCPDRIDLLHQHFRKICHLLADFDYFGQTVALQVLTSYARTQFLTPFKKGPNGEDDDEMDGDAFNEKKGAFYSDEDEDEDEDDNSEKNKKEMDPDHRLLIRSATILLNSADASVICGVCSLMMNIAPLAEARQCAPAVARHLSNYREMQYVVLANVSTMASKRPSMFRQYVKMFFVFWDDPEYIRELKLDILAHLSSDSTIGPILMELFSYVHHYDPKFVHQAIRTIGRCAMTIPDTAERCLHMLLRLVSNSSETVVAQSISVIRTLLQRNPKEHVKVIKRMSKLLFKVKIAMARTALVWIVGEYREMIPKIAPDCLRQLAKTFREEDVEVKLQVLNLAVKLYLSNPRQTALLFKYIMDLSKSDINFDVRDRARMVRALFFKKKSAGGDEQTEAWKARTKTIMKRCFLWAKPVPETENPFKAREPLTLGSLSHLVQHSVSGYQSLSEFPEVAPDTSVREEPRAFGEDDDDVTSKKPKRGFYDFNETDSDSDTDSDTDSDSDTSSDSGSDDSSSSDDDDSSDDPDDTERKPRKKDQEEEDSSGSSDSDSDSDSEEEKPKKPKDSKLSAPTPAKPAEPAANLLDLFDNDESGNNAPGQGQAPGGGGVLAGLSFEDTFISGSAISKGPQMAPSGGLEGKKGVHAKVRATRSGPMGVLLKESLGEGLGVWFSFVRQDSIYSKAMTVVELKFQASVEVRDIHIDNVNAPGVQIRPFDRIPVLHAHQTVTSKMHLDFKGSERKVKFNICTTDRKYSVSIIPTPGDLLRPHIMSVEEFDNTKKRLTGMSQTQFETSSFISSEALAKQIGKFADVAVLASNPSDPDVFRMAAEMRHESTSLVLITVRDQGNEMQVTINCDDMLFSGRLEDYLSKVVED